MTQHENKIIAPYADLDKSRFMLVSALRHYEKRLNDLAGNEEIVQLESEIFKNYLVEAAKQAGIAGDELRQDPREVATAAKEEKYRSIVKQALTYYIADLSKSKNIIREKLGEDNPILIPYENETKLAEMLRESVSDATPPSPP
jgi:hypothetical protein